MKHSTSHLRPLKIAALLAACVSSGVFAAAPNKPVLEGYIITPKSYGFVEILATSGSESYKNSVKLNDKVEIPLPFNIWHNGFATKAYAVIDGVRDPESMITLAPENAQKGSPVAHPKTAGKKKLQVEACNAADECSLSDELDIMVLDTLPEYADVLPDNADKANIPHTNTTGSVVAAYFPTWGVYSRKFTVDQVPVENLTHILYGFIPLCGGDGINDSLKPIEAGLSYASLQRACAGLPDFTAVIHDIWGEMVLPLAGQTSTSPLKGVLGQMMAAKKRNPDLKILPSVGGWTLSDPFYFLGDAGKRKVFVDSMENFLLTWKFFDGIDIDWEFPGGKGANPGLGDPVNDGATYVTLMKELREMMDRVSQKTGKTYQLTSAIGAGQDKIDMVNYAEATQYMDYIFDMTYDFSGAWTMTDLGHHAALNGPSWDKERPYSTSNSIQTLLAQGVNSKKLVVGAAMYGRGWTGVRGMTDPGNPFTGTASGPMPGKYEAGIADYKLIKAEMVDKPENGYQTGYDDHAEAPYAFNPSTGVLVTYENGRSTEAKGKFVLTQQLGGMFSWDITGDNGDILNAMHDGLNHPPTDGEIHPKPPVAIAGPNQTVTGPANIALDGSQSSNPQDDPLQYEWKQISGTILAMTGADQAIAHIDVPAVETDTIYGFTLTVKNAVGTHSANTTVTAKPKAEEILPPVAHLTGPATAEAKQQVALSAAASSDPAGKPLTYEWTIPAGITASTNDAALSFTAPELAADTPFTFSVKVSNGSKTDSASHTVTVKKSADEVVLPPVARIAGPETAKANARVELSAASSSDPADKPLTYKWTVPAGITASENGAALSFTAPELTANTPFTFSVEVSNGTKTDTANHVVTVQKKDDTGTPTYPHYVPGTAYKAGDVVQNAAALYQCVVAGWCSSASAMYYAPGTGLDWASAWKTFDGEGEITPPPNPGDAPPYVAGTAYNFGDLVSNNDKVYSCKVPGWCSGPAWAYEPGKGTDWQSAWTEQ